ncbi:hypothetical protein GTW25_16965 [Aliihoeflea aestuarii]|uniref:pyroglutamyl-peptidase I n=1 Tax=Aliihoeflea aestuarii TaxID=453840 RepID=UPI002094CD0F|nr:pyroglutamyl-peptidase I [Aliihoeflea aestuarii]MCO6392719.1 hypothetical protein [Aliihoeflea aestuarii]
MTNHRRPRILLTGFSVFPGAPVNPTEALVENLTDTPPTIDAEFRAAVLSVEYETIAAQLSALCEDYAPVIALHFGLAQACHGFRLERIARNTNAQARPDNLGNLPSSQAICDGPETLVSTLPLKRIAHRFEAAGLPVEWSEDAGGYLCNTVFTLSAAHACDGLAPSMTGFIHVPPPDRMKFADLRRGALIALDACVTEWREGI